MACSGVMLFVFITLLFLFSLGGGMSANRTLRPEQRKQTRQTVIPTAALPDLQSAEAFASENVKKTVSSSTVRALFKLYLFANGILQYHYSAHMVCKRNIRAWKVIVVKVLILLLNVTLTTHLCVCPRLCRHGDLMSFWRQHLRRLSLRRCRPVSRCHRLRRCRSLQRPSSQSLNHRPLTGNTRPEHITFKKPDGKLEQCFC